MSTKDNVRLVRLLSGEELLGEVVMSTTKWLNEHTPTDVPADLVAGPITLRHPFQVMTRPGHHGQMNIGIIPWIPYRKNDTVTIRGSIIVFVEEADTELAANWLRATSNIALPASATTGLVLPGK
jgi:hypothetical protein